MYANDKKGFTLTELIVTVGILAVLTALGFPALSKARQASDRAGCLSNLRQVGSLMSLYAAENNNRLPGPDVSVGVYAAFYSDQNLVGKLAPYLGIETEKTWRFSPSIFVCPAFKRAVKIPSKATESTGLMSYVLTSTINKPGWPGIYPWGSSAVGSPRPNPATLMEVAGTAPNGLIGTWAMMDVDQMLGDSAYNGTEYQINKAMGGYSNLPKEMVHGNGRCLLFFDFHAEFRPMKP